MRPILGKQFDSSHFEGAPPQIIAALEYYRATGRLNDQHIADIRTWAAELSPQWSHSPSNTLLQATYDEELSREGLGEHKTEIIHHGMISGVDRSIKTRGPVIT